MKYRHQIMTAAITMSVSAFVFTAYADGPPRRTFESTAPIEVVSAEDIEELNAADVLNTIPRGVYLNGMADARSNLINVRGQPTDVVIEQAFQQGLALYNIMLDDRATAVYDSNYYSIPDTTPLAVRQQQAIDLTLGALDADQNGVPDIRFQVSAQYGYTKFGDELGGISAGTLVYPNMEGAAVSSGIDEMQTYTLRMGMVTTFGDNPYLRSYMDKWGIKTMMPYIEYTQGSEDDSSMLGFNEPWDVGADGLGLTYFEELEFMDYYYGSYFSTGLFLGNSFGFEGEARSELDFTDVRIGLEEEFMEGVGCLPFYKGLRKDVGLFRREFDIQSWSSGFAGFGGQIYDDLGQTNMSDIEVTQTGVYAGFQLERPIFGNGIDDTLYVTAGVNAEVFSNNAQAWIGQYNFCGLCSGPEISSSVDYSYDEKDWKIGGGLDLGIRYEFADTNVSVGAEVFYQVTPGIPVFEQATSPNTQPSRVHEIDVDNSGAALTINFHF